MTTEEEIGVEDSIKARVEAEEESIYIRFKRRYRRKI